MLSVQDLHNNRANFCKSQQSRIDVLWHFVQDQRIKRKQACTAACALPLLHYRPCHWDLCSLLCTHCLEVPALLYYNNEHGRCRRLERGCYGCRARRQRRHEGTRRRLRRPGRSGARRRCLCAVGWDRPETTVRKCGSDDYISILCDMLFVVVLRFLIEKRLESFVERNGLLEMVTL